VVQRIYDSDVAGFKLAGNACFLQRLQEAFIQLLFVSTSRLKYCIARPRAALVHIFLLLAECLPDQVSAGPRRDSHCDLIGALLRCSWIAAAISIAWLWISFTRDVSLNVVDSRAYSR